MTATDLDLSSCERLICAISVAAIKDARRGDQEAAAWLLRDALPWLEMIGLGGIDESDLRQAIEGLTL